jgi:hypothetical protein
MANSAFRFILTAFFLCLLCYDTAYSQSVLKLGSNDLPGNGSLSELTWLSGYWEGSGLGGECDEVWIPQQDKSMAGIFRYSREGVLVFSEYMIIEEIGKSLSLKLKHFNRDLSPWEEKDEWVEFKLIKIVGETAWFDGLTYKREQDKLSVWILLDTGGDERIEEFIYHKSQI